MVNLVKKIVFVLLFGITSLIAQKNTTYWQQHVDYAMEVAMDVETFQYEGTQKLVYTNNSPDELNRVYYHLYYNAFQPGSEMDIRLQTIKDGDKRMLQDGKSRIGSLTESEVGFLHVKTLTQDGAKVDFKEEETILVVD